LISEIHRSAREREEKEEEKEKKKKKNEEEEESAPHYAPPLPHASTLWRTSDVEVYIEVCLRRGRGSWGEGWRQ